MNISDFDDDDSPFVDVPSVELEIAENPIVGELLGPRGETLFVIHERRTVPFGYQR